MLNLKKIIQFFSLVLIGGTIVLPVSADEFLTPEEAFPLEVISTKNGAKAIFSLPKNIYLYEFQTNVTAFNGKIGELKLQGNRQLKEDKIYGESYVYYDKLLIDIPFQSSDAEVELNISNQGCTDQGLCYAPMSRLFKVKNLSLAENQTNSLPLSRNDSIFSAAAKTDEVFEHRVLINANSLLVSFSSEPGHYIYKDMISVTLNEKLLKPKYYPEASNVDDKNYGDVEIYKNAIDLEFGLPKLKSNDNISISYQGCADQQICFPPVIVSYVASSIDGFKSNLPMPNNNKTFAANLKEIFSSAYGGSSIDGIFATNSAFLLLAIYFGLGLLLAFTPCTFPALPILTAVVLGERKKNIPNIAIYRKFFLPAVFVLAMSLTYTFIGILIGLLGQSLQAQLQQPIVTFILAVIFVTLALAMFGLFQMQLPVFIQNKLNQSVQKLKGGTYSSAIGLGIVSALIIGPCMTPPLVAAILQIGQSGNYLLGGLSLFVMGLGMGLPMIIFALSARRFLPSSGMWLKGVNKVFGYLFLLMAIWMLSRVLPSFAIWLLIAILLVAIAIHLILVDTSANHKLLAYVPKTISIAIVILATIIGIKQFETANWNMLKNTNGIEFSSITGLQVLNKNLELAKQNDKIVMVNIVADWCISCKELELITFSDEAVVAATNDLVSLELDITANSPESLEFTKKYLIIGPPTILFFKNGIELEEFRIVGFMGAKSFLSHLDKAKKFSKTNEMAGKII